MKRKPNTHAFIAAVLLCLSMWFATNVFATGPTLSEIPPLDGVSANEGRAITPDGQYVVGLSGTASGFLYPVGSASSILVLSADNAGATIANGVGYRTALDPVYATNRTELIICGMSAGYVTEWMTADGGVSFGNKRRNTSFTYGIQGAVNQVGSTLGSDAYYVSSRKSGTGQPIYLNQGAGTWVATMTYSSKGIATGDTGETVLGLSGSGRGVGSRINGGVRKNYMLTWNGTATPAAAFFSGLAGTQEGTGFAVSAVGNTVFGRSPIVTGGTDLYGYKTTFTGGAGGTNGTTQGPVVALPEFSDTAGSISRSVPYGCTADGLYPVGMQYRGQERAVIWDTSNADPNIWTVLDLTDLARNNGFLGDFTLNLRRAYSAGTNASGDIVVTGWGVNSGTTTRAFVMAVPKWIAAIGFPGNQTVNFGANVTINLKTNGTDALSFQWYKNGTQLPGATSTSVSLSSVSCAGGQAGTYSVVVSNAPISAVITGAMTLTVLDPFIVTQPATHGCAVGSNTTFTVSAGGAPTLSYKWQRGGSDLSDGATGWGSTVSGSSTATLTISSVTQTDGSSGDYTVVVTTSAGGCTITSRAATLTVLDGMPVLDSVVRAGADYTLNVSGPPGQTYKVLYSTNVVAPLGSWKPLITNTFSGTVGLDSYTDTAPANSQRFYILTSP